MTTNINITFLELLIFGLAVFRLTLLISSEDGPMYLFRKLRRAIPKESSAKKGIQCKWCVSVWMAISVSLYYVLRDHLSNNIISLGNWFILMLAFSAIAIIINQQFTRDSIK